jgi:signal transduction histidine kinase
VPRLADWSLRRRLAAALALLATVLFALVVAAVVLLVQVHSQQRAVIDRYFTAVNLSNARFTAQLDAETAVRGYALTADAATLAPLHSLQSRSYAAAEVRLTSLLRDPGTVSSLRAWDAAATGWYEKSALPTITAIKAHGTRTVTDRQVLTGKRLFDANRSKFTAFSARLVATRNAASSSLRLRTTLLFVAVILVAASLALAGGGTWWAMRRWVLGPLAAIGAETRMVTTGALDHEVLIDGPAEVRRLASDVDAMRREIVDQLAAVEGARLEIETSRRMLVAQAQDLARSNRDLEQFAYVASHDLQEPLRKVASFCQMLERRYSGQLDERADQYIAFAVDGAKRMQQLINDLLAFSRVGRETSSFVDVDLHHCLAEARGNLAVAIASSGAEVDATPLPQVRGDAVLLTQLLQNLIGNSIKFAGASSPQVRITARLAGEYWELACSDNGLGVDAQYADRIFVLFQRLHPKDEYPGTGIGLALCKRIVEHHGGQIWLDTTVSSGATFRWTLPAVGDTSTQDVSGRESA